MPESPNPYLMRIYSKAFAAQNPALVQVSFRDAVLERYRASNAYELVRTDTVGRIKREGGWALDVGIGEGTVHATVHDLLYALPDDEREHWAQYVVALPMSDTFLQMRLLGGGACIDDGEVREWE